MPLTTIDSSDCSSLTGWTKTESASNTVTAGSGQIDHVRGNASGAIGIRRTSAITGTDSTIFEAQFQISGSFADWMFGIVDADATDYTQMVGFYQNAAASTIKAWEKDREALDNSTQGGLSLDATYTATVEIEDDGKCTMKLGGVTVGTTVVSHSGNYIGKSLRWMVQEIGGTLSTFELLEYEVTALVNAAPVADAGTDQTVDINTGADLEGSSTDDGLPETPGAVTYLWTQVSGPGTATFTDDTDPETHVDFDVSGEYVLELEADDGELSDTDTVTITANEAPTADAGSDQNVTIGAGADLDGSGTDDGFPDPPATLTYSWAKFSGPGTVTFDDNTDPETHADFSVSGTYVLRLTVSDSHLSDTDDVTIRVNAAPTADAGSNQSVAVSAGADLDGSATDEGLPNPPAALTYSWSKLSGPGSVTFADSTDPTTHADFETPGIYVLRLTVSDGSLSDTDDVQIHVFEKEVAAQILLLLTPLTDVNTYGSEVDITDYIEEDGLPSVTTFIDSEDYDIGIFSYGSIQFTLDNEKGSFNDYSDPRSLFTYFRDLSKVRMVFRQYETLRNSEGVVVSTVVTDTTLFKGLIRDEATRLDPASDRITMEALSLESIISNVRISPGAINDDSMTTTAFLEILDNTKVTSLLTVSSGNIDPDLNLTIDDGGFFDALSGLEAIKTLLTATNSVLLINADNEIVIRNRDVDSDLYTLELYGKNDIHGRENIISLSDYNNGFHRIANSIRSSRVESNDTGSIDEIGLRQKQIDFEFITTEGTLQTIADRILAEFLVPKIECKVRIPMSIGKSVSLLQRVTINMPLYIEPSGTFLPVIGGADYGDAAAPYPIEIGSVEILPTTIFKVIEIEHDLAAMETTLKLRQIGTTHEDGFSA